MTVAEQASNFMAVTTLLSVATVQEEPMVVAVPDEVLGDDPLAHHVHCLRTESELKKNCEKLEAIESKLKRRCDLLEKRLKHRD